MTITYKDIINKFNGKDELILGNYKLYLMGPAKTICIEDTKTGYDIAPTIVSDDFFEDSNGWVKVHINSISKKMVRKPVNNAIAIILSELKNLDFENRKNEFIKSVISNSAVNNDTSSIKTFGDIKNIILQNGTQVQNDDYDDNSHRDRFKYSIKHFNYILLKDTSSDGSVSEWIYFEKNDDSINNADFWKDDSLQYFSDTNSWKKIKYNSVSNDTESSFITGTIAKALNTLFGIKEIKKSKKEKDDVWYKVFAEVIENKYNVLASSNYKDVIINNNDKPDDLYDKFSNSDWYVCASNFDIPTRYFHALMQRLNLLERYETNSGNKYYRPVNSRKEASASRNECVTTFFNNHGSYLEFCEFYNVKEIFEKVLKKDGKYTPSDIESYYE